jgi:hypothetical protein
MKYKFNLEKIIEDINKFIAEDHIIAPTDKNKVFYNYDEWSGWRFYWKAITNKDWKSLINYVRSTYGNK